MKKGSGGLVLLASMTLSLYGSVQAAPVPAPTLAVALTVRPAPVPASALKYQLLPELADMTHGNAALQYYRTFSPEWWQTVQRQPNYPKFLEHTSTPLKGLPRKELKWILNFKALNELDIAARKETCDWDMTSRIREEGVNLLLPDMQGFREVATLLALKARLQMAEGHYEPALYTLQTGFAMGRHISEAPTLISNLVGIAVVQLMLKQVEDLIQAPGAPNLYWALTTLPKPLIDIRRALQGERLLLLSAIPELRGIERGRLSAEKREKLMDNLLDLLHGVGRGSDMDGRRIELMVMVMKAYPEAKEALVAAGRKAEEVEDLPVLQVAAIHSLHEFSKLQDDLYKWLSVPYPQARPGLDQAERQFRDARNKGNLLPFYELLPSVSKVAEAKAQLERKIAAMRCIEAVRWYAAGHEGHLPNTLDAITEVPIPIDPMTGKCFGYKLMEENTFHLYGGPLENEVPNQRNVISYVVTVERQGK